MQLSDFSEDFPLLTQRLRQVKINGRTGQAYLFLGDNPQFLEQFAKAWARTAACTGNSSDGNPCNNCKPCKLFKQDTYPEYIVLRPQSKSRMITVESMRQFEHDLSLASMPGLMKIGVIVEAECLGDEAQNAFLKTLEEPPKNTMLLLLTVNARKLLPTIRSRCQTISLLRNRQDYTIAHEKGLFNILQKLKRQAGAAVAMKASAELTKMLAELRKDAEATAEEMIDRRWDNVDDPRIKKQLEEEQTARVEAEYVRLRETMLDALQAWFLQRYLIAAGVQPKFLPQPDMLDVQATIIAKPPTPQEADEDITQAEELVRCIKANVDERLAIDTFCLTVTEKTQRR
ncbi:MAG: hypothetical protein ACOX6W_00245 [Lentisphaeria bacterium]|jgi:DNA polymerase-3 subunit delta'|nr:hypothetical protein [Lentisphaerota bacterium]